MCVLDMQLYPSVFIHPVFLDEIVCLWPPKFTCYYPSLPLLFFFIRMFIFVSYVVIVFSIYIYIVLAVSPYKYYTDVVSLTLQYLDVTFVFCFIFSLIFIALRELTPPPGRCCAFIGRLDLANQRLLFCPPFWKPLYLFMFFNLVFGCDISTIFGLKTIYSTWCFIPVCVIVWNSFSSMCSRCVFFLALQACVSHTWAVSYAESFSTCRAEVDWP